MSDWIVVDGVKPYDGRYELELGDGGFTTREWGWLKRYAGVLPVTLDANTFTDPEVIAVLAIIAIRRNGTVTVDQVGEMWERLLDAPFGTTIRFEPGEVEEADADGPPVRSLNGSEPTSGLGSTTSSASSDETPAATGMLASGSSASGPVKWGT